MTTRSALEPRAPKRRRVHFEKTFEERLTEEAERFRDAAAKAAPGMARELLLRRVQQAERTLRLNNWLTSPGLRSPTHS
jgi:hypothetical protein